MKAHEERLKEEVKLNQCGESILKSLKLNKSLLIDKKKNENIIRKLWNNGKKNYCVVKCLKLICNLF